MIKTTIILIVLALFSTSTAELTPDRFDQLTGTLWYGIYMQDMKTGYAKISLEKEDSLTWNYNTELMMKLSNGQTEITLESKDSRVYNGNEAYIIANKYVTEGDIGSITIIGNSDGENYTFEMDVMGNKQLKTLEFPLESLDDYLLIQMKAIEGKLNIGDKIKQEIFVFDPSILNKIEHVVTLTGKKELQLSGVATEVYTFIDSIPSMRIGGTSTIDMNGNIIYQEFPSMGIVMKLETEEIARDVTTGYDIIANSIISVENGPEDSRIISEAKYKLIGFDSKYLPENNWTKIESVTGDTIEITISSPLNDYKLPQKLSLNFPYAILKYLISEPLIQSETEEIKALADSIKGKNHTDFQTAKAINRWVFENINKQFCPDISNAVQTLKLKRGDCGEHSALTVALLRAAGIPAQIAVGIAYVPSLNGFGYHAWVEVYVGEWIQMDPTWGEDIADAMHIMLARGSLDEQITGINGSMNNLQVEILEFK